MCIHAESSRNYRELWGYLTSRICSDWQDLGWRPGHAAVGEKLDGSPITAADIALEHQISEVLRRFDADATIIAEESWHGPPPDMTGVVWTVDSIDGTRQFTSRQGSEYCTAIAAFETGLPVACLIVAPHLGTTREPVVIAVDGWGLRPTVNGETAKPRRVCNDAPLHVSITGRASPADQLKPLVSTDRLILKCRATSLTLDMVRTCIDIRDLTGLCGFDWFYRAHQKIWDAGPGIVLAAASNLAAVDGYGSDLWPVRTSRLDAYEPSFPTVLVAQPPATASILALLDVKHNTSGDFPGGR
jgi:fructose-1,6-bisphosphatase/inositol monophosphatase family enzyme